MKKKTVALITALTLAISLSACGNDEPASNNNSDAERIAELEQELAELKAGNKDTESTKPTAEPETWSDDTIIAFTDESMLKEVRKITGVNERDITYGDVKNITEFEGGYSNIAPLKYFTALVNLDVTTENDTSLDSLRSLNSLVALRVQGKNLTDISGIGNLPRLEELSILDCDSLTDLSSLRNLPKLEMLEIESRSLTTLDTLGNIDSLKSLRINCKEIITIDGIKQCINIENLEVLNGKFSDISPLSSLTRLISLRIGFDQGYRFENDVNKNIADIKPISNLVNLKSLQINGSFTDISPLGNLTNLISLEINGNFTDISPIESLTNLTRLNIKSDNIADVSPISSLINLQYLNICGGQFSTLEIGGCTNLEVLSVYKNNNLTDIKPISNLTNLTELCLGVDDFYSQYMEPEDLCAGITDISPIGNLINLRELHLNCGLSKNSDISALANLPEYVTISVVDSDKKIQNKGDLYSWLIGKFFD